MVDTNSISITSGPYPGTRVHVCVSRRVTGTDRGRSVSTVTVWTCAGATCHRDLPVTLKLGQQCSRYPGPAAVTVPRRPTLLLSAHHTPPSGPYPGTLGQSHKKRHPGRIPDSRIRIPDQMHCFSDNTGRTGSYPGRNSYMRRC
eukprot:2454006-Rhodomonas_salina.1